MISHCEAINWQFLPVEIFASSRLAMLLLGYHIISLVLFLNKHFTVFEIFRSLVSKPFSADAVSPARKGVVVMSML